MRRTRVLLVLFGVCIIGNVGASALRGEPFLGEIRMFAGNFAPRGWAFCDGQLLPVSQYSALFSLLGTTYGGDGRVTFGLPDLRGRVPIHPGRGPGLTPRRLGEMSGVERVKPVVAGKATVARAGSTSAIPVPSAESRENMQPHLAIHYIIALQGVFPSRNGGPDLEPHSSRPARNVAPADPRRGNVIRPKKVDAKVMGCQVSGPDKYRATVGDLIELEYTFPVIPSALPKKVGQEADKGALYPSTLGIRHLIVPNIVGTGTYLFYFEAKHEGTGTVLVVIDDVKYEYSFTVSEAPKER